MNRRSLLTLPFGFVAGCASTPVPFASSPPDRRGLVLSVGSYRFPRATVTLKNTGTAPVSIYAESCSWGFGALQVEFSSGRHIIGGYRKGDFTVNVPAPTPLAAGASRVFRLIMDEEHWHFQSALPKSFAGWKVRWRYDTGPAVEPGYPGDQVLPIHLATPWMDA